MKTTQHSLDIPVEEEFRAAKTGGKRWPTGNLPPDSKARIVKTCNSLTSPCSLDQLVVVTCNVKMRAIVHRMTPKHLVHVTKDSERLHIFCRRRPLLLALMGLRRRSYELYVVLSDFFKHDARDVVWPETVPPPRRPQLLIFLDCDRCDRTASVLHWRGVQLCSACFDEDVLTGLPPSL